MIPGGLNRCRLPVRRGSARFVSDVYGIGTVVRRFSTVHPGSLNRDKLGYQTGNVRTGLQDLFTIDITIATESITGLSIVTFTAFYV